ncbi:MAG: hypothetical protein A2475_10415 [Ignavibacteria bacterium RIFOXYC2_FULL_35_21]|nr:MAG: hypothetical protein A2475_10415 [Ignavibacteria bacterium RIFOXYC2_FULL_35_21]
MRRGITRYLSGSDDTKKTQERREEEVEKLRERACGVDVSELRWSQHEGREMLEMRQTQTMKGVKR